ncbi:cingulin isoform X1 [Hydra vulgaris]|uniref:cingulin isoform X1 n=1 Tax=Hydra vulgaris TaxID=6087 RepID=UPI0032EA79B1
MGGVNKSDEKKTKTTASSVPTSNLPLIYTSKAYATQDRNPLNSSIAIRKSGDGYINVESEYIQNLLQQVHLLELEVSYLKDKYHKRQIPLNLVLESEKLAEKVKASEYELSIREQEINSKENAIALLHQEQQEFKSKIELLTESFNVEKKELVNEIVSLKKQVERYELDQARQNSQIEKLKFDFDSCMLSLSGSKSQVQVLQNRLEEKTNDFNAMRVAFEEKLAESLKVQTELKQLEDKYFYSRERSKEQVDSVLKNELKELRFSFREKEIQADQDRTLRIKISEDCGNLIKENAALSSQIIELKKQLEIESEFKEDVHYRKQSTIQELVTLKEEVKQKDRELERLREQLSSQHERMANAMKNLLNEEESHKKLRHQCVLYQSQLEETQCLESKQKKENIELKRDNVLLTDHVNELRSKLESKTEDLDKFQLKYRNLESQLASLRSKLRLQSSLDNIRWDELENIADQMKQFSRTISPIRPNTAYQNSRDISTEDN